MPISAETDAVQLLNELEASLILGLSASFLQRARVRGDGPAYLKLGRLVRYRPSDLHEWAAARRRSSTSDGVPHT